MPPADRPRTRNGLTETIEQQDTRQPKDVGRTSAGMSRLELRAASARSVCREKPPLVAPDRSLAEALDLMRQRRGEAVLVCEDGRLVGILTERDVLQRIVGHDVDLGRPLRDYMTADPHALPADTTLLEAMQAMESGGYRNLPLLEDGRVVGLLRQHDLLDYIAEAFPQEILNLPPRPHQLMEEPEGA
jgi:CBS domain-containing protein